MKKLDWVILVIVFAASAVAFLIVGRLGGDVGGFGFGGIGGSGGLGGLVGHGSGSPGGLGDSGGFESSVGGSGDSGGFESNIGGSGDSSSGPGASGNYAEVYLKNELIMTIDLREDRIVEVENPDGYNLLEVKSGSIRMSEADCLSQTCVHTGAKSSGGAMIVCLPNRVVVKIVGAAAGEGIAGAPEGDVGAPEGVDIVAG